MKINTQKLEELIKERFKNNKTEFAESIGVSREYVSKLFNKEKNVTSAKICNAIILYCEANGLDYKNYIFLE